MQPTERAHTPASVASLIELECGFEALEDEKENNEPANKAEELRRANVPCQLTGGRGQAASAVCRR